MILLQSEICGFKRTLYGNLGWLASVGGRLPLLAARILLLFHPFEIY